MGVAGMASGLAAEPVGVSGRAMGTRWMVRYVPSGATPEADEIRRRVAARLEELEQIFSAYREHSEVSRFNAHASTEWFAVTPELVSVAAECRTISERTRGAFDVSVAPLLARWGFGPAGTSERLPTDAEVHAARAHVDFRRLEMRLVPPALRKTHASLAVDFSSMAKGFAADEVSAMLCRLGAPNHLAQIGGDVKTSGSPAQGSTWRIGVEDPSKARDAIAAIVALDGSAAMSTSGNHRNAIVRGGQRHGHIIDPRTGRPVESSLLSVSVVHPSCAKSSAWATGLFVLGLDEGWRVAQQHGLAALFLVNDGDAVVARSTAEFDRRRAAERGAASPTPETAR